MVSDTIQRDELERLAKGFAGCGRKAGEIPFISGDVLLPLTTTSYALKRTRNNGGFVRPIDSVGFFATDREGQGVWRILDDEGAIDVVRVAAPNSIVVKIPDDQTFAALVPVVDPEP